MWPAMAPNEIALLLSFLRKSEKYLEFGCGGSTFLASSHVKSWIISIDSSSEWLETVHRACTGNPAVLDLVLADIGPTGPWGYPTDPATRPRWRNYHSGIWSVPKSMDADLYLVDGRFRVACFAQVVLHCRPNAIIGIHDFSSRQHYHAVHNIAKEICSAEEISFFHPLPHKRETAIAILEEFGNNPM